MQMKFIITRKALYLALFWKLGLWNTEMAFRSMKHEIDYFYPWFAGFIPDEFAHLYVIRASRKWKQSLLSPYLTVSISIVPFENHFVQIAPEWESPQIQRLLKFRCCFYMNKYCVFTLAENFLFFWTFSVFFVDFRVIHSEGHEVHHKVVPTSTNTFFLASFIHTFNQFVIQYFTGLRWSVVLFFF